MAKQALGISRVTESSSSPHLEPNEVASYVDGALDAAGRARFDAHLVSCDHCRAEVAEVSLVAAAMRTRRRRKSFLIPAGAVAAAAILFMLLPPRGRAPSERREGPLSTAISPRALSPVGLVDSSSAITWSAVPNAERYDVHVFDSSGAMLWQYQTADTTVTVPPTVRLQPLVPYYWRVEATTGFDRATRSDLVGFSVRRARAP